MPLAVLRHVKPPFRLPRLEAVRPSRGPGRLSGHLELLGQERAAAPDAALALHLLLLWNATDQDLLPLWDIIVVPLLVIVLEGGLRVPRWSLPPEVLPALLVLGNGRFVLRRFLPWVNCPASAGQCRDHGKVAAQDLLPLLRHQPRKVQTRNVPGIKGVQHSLRAEVRAPREPKVHPPHLEAWVPLAPTPLEVHHGRPLCLCIVVVVEPTRIEGRVRMVPAPHQHIWLEIDDVGCAEQLCCADKTLKPRVRIPAAVLCRCPLEGAVVFWEFADLTKVHRAAILQQVYWRVRVEATH
mmetsp:Transcript_72683/g.200581  ORF Transcript_72683/g.200581 Transcript_72683/m.200581 type:complete len:296 (-) Transcript_72683:320-1207(-)